MFALIPYNKVILKKTVQVLKTIKKHGRTCRGNGLLWRMGCVSNALHFLVTLTWCKDVVVSQRFSNCKKGMSGYSGTIFELLWETQEVKWVL